MGTPNDPKDAHDIIAAMYPYLAESSVIYWFLSSSASLMYVCM